MIKKIITQFSGTLYPDKSFSIGMVPRKSKKKSDRKYDNDYYSQVEKDYEGLTDWYVGTNSLGGSFQSVTEGSLFIEGSKSSRDKRGSYGAHGITSYGRKFVKCTSILLQKKYTKERLGFVTCTMPSFPEDVHRRLNGVWGEIVRRFYQKVKRQLEKVQKPFIYVGVTEIQEKRFKRTHIPVPHLHFVYLCRSTQKSKYWIYICQIHRAWNQAIREGIGLCGYPYNMSANIPWGSTHAKTVQKSASAYLGKYMSKGCQVIADMKASGWNQFPRQWWTACMQCKKMFKESLINLDSHFCSSIFQNLAEYLHEQTITWARFVDVLMDDRYVCIGVVGTFSNDAYRLLVT